MHFHRQIKRAAQIFISCSFWPWSNILNVSNTIITIVLNTKNIVFFLFLSKIMINHKTNYTVKSIKHNHWAAFPNVNPLFKMILNFFLTRNSTQLFALSMFCDVRKRCMNNYYVNVHGCFYFMHFNFWLNSFHKRHAVESFK